MPEKILSSIKKKNLIENLKLHLPSWNIRYNKQAQKQTYLKKITKARKLMFNLRGCIRLTVKIAVQILTDNYIYDPNTKFYNQNRYIINPIKEQLAIFMQIITL